LVKDEQKFNNNKLKYLISETEITLFGLKNNRTRRETNFKQLVYHSTIYDDNSEEDKIKIKKKLLNYYDNFDLIYNHEDMHFYLFNKAIFALLEDEKIKTMNLIKTELIPFLINNTYNRRLRNIIKDYNLNKDSNENEINVDTSHNKKVENLKIFAYLIGNKDYAL
jgi:hypothetical protein